MSARGSAVAIVVVYPDLLGTYGDGGNAVVLAQRLRWRGHPAEVIEVPAGTALPELADIYCLGGGEDGPQSQAASVLAADGGLSRALARGALVLAVCAGFQIAGRVFPGAGGRPHAGLGLIDAETVQGRGPRAVGELATDAGGGVGLLTGYENHSGVTTLGPDAAPLGRVLAGVGNGDGSRVDGAVAGGVVATYMHGPVLARNPALADSLCSRVAGPLAPLEVASATLLHDERLARATRARGLRRFLPAPL